MIGGTMETSASYEAWSAPSSYPAIEPTSEAWEANLKARKRTNWRHFCVFQHSSNGFQLEQRRSNRVQVPPSAPSPFLFVQKTCKNPHKYWLFRTLAEGQPRTDVDTLGTKSVPIRARFSPPPSKEKSPGQQPRLRSTFGTGDWDLRQPAISARALERRRRKQIETALCR